MNGLCGQDEFHESPLIGMGTDAIEGVYPYPYPGWQSQLGLQTVLAGKGQTQMMMDGV